MARVIPTWWSRAPAPGNLGDVLTPIVLAGLGVQVRWTDLSEARLLAIGSVIRFARPGQLVWGSGAMWSHDAPTPSAKYLAVRGPLTRAAVIRAGGTCPEVYGDPALLLRLLHDRPVRVRHDVGVVPHYVDEEEVRSRLPGEYVISPLDDDPLVVVDRIRACRAIVSSSLHGIIVAHAYGIPAAWWRVGDRLDGDDVKFRDHAAALGVELAPAVTLGDAVPVAGHFDPAPLLTAMEALR